MKELSKSIQSFLLDVQKNPDLTFYVTLIGCGLANLAIPKVAELFRKAIQIPNILLPIEFWNKLNENKCLMQIPHKDHILKELYFWKEKLSIYCTRQMYLSENRWNLFSLSGYNLMNYQNFDKWIAVDASPEGWSDFSKDAQNKSNYFIQTEKSSKMFELRGILESLYSRTDLYN